MESCSLPGGPLLGVIQAGDLAGGHGRVTSSCLELELDLLHLVCLLFRDVRSGRCLVPSAPVLQPRTSVDEAGWRVPTPSHSEPQASQKTCVLEAFNKEIWIQPRNEEVGM